MRERAPSFRSPGLRAMGRNVDLALRMIVKTPIVTIVAIVSLALGIGANAAIFPSAARFCCGPCRSLIPVDW